MFGPKMAALFRQVKALFDPNVLFNPGKIIDAPDMDLRDLFRFAPGYSVDEFQPSLTGQHGPVRQAVCKGQWKCVTITGRAASWKVV